MQNNLQLSHPAKIKIIQFDSENKQLLLSYSIDKTLIIWDLSKNTKKFQTQFNDFDLEIVNLQYPKFAYKTSKNNQIYFTDLQDDILKTKTICESQKLPQIWVLLIYKEFLYAHSNGNYVFLWNYDKNHLLYSMKLKEEIIQISCSHNLFWIETRKGVFARIHNRLKNNVFKLRNCQYKVTSQLFLEKNEEGIITLETKNSKILRVFKGFANIRLIFKILTLNHKLILCCYNQIILLDFDTGKRENFDNKNIIYQVIDDKYYFCQDKNICSKQFDY